MRNIFTDYQGIITPELVQEIREKNLFFSLRSGEISDNPEIHKGFTNHNPYHRDLMKQVHEMFCQGLFPLHSLYKNIGFETERKLYSLFSKPKYGFKRPDWKTLVQLYPEKKTLWRQKVKQTNFERFGVEVPLHSAELMEKFKKTNLERYGVDNPTKSKEIVAKVKQTNRERYGVDYYSQLPDFKEIVKQTNLERYGVKHPFILSEFQEKAKQTCLERYGVEYASQSPEIKEKTRQTSLERYGVKYPMQSPIFQERVRQTRYRKDPRFLIISKFKTLEDVLEYGRENYSSKYLYKLCNQLGFRFPERFSSPELMVFEFLRNLQEQNPEHFEFETHCRPDFLDGQELDFLLTLRSGKKIAIEINGIYWHSTKFKDRLYHQRKKEKCVGQGISLLSITDIELFEKYEIFCSILKNKLGLSERKIFARKCDIKVLKNSDIKEFLVENHLQGYCPAKISLGLFYENELVQVATFSTTRFGKEREFWELIRLCTLKDANVIGGFSKLLKFFKKSQNIEKVLTFADANLSESADACIYANISENAEYLGLSSPDLKFFYQNRQYSRQKMMKQNLHKLFPEFPRREDKENYDQMTTSNFYAEKGIFQVYGCGNYKFLI